MILGCRGFEGVLLERLLACLEELGSRVAVREARNAELERENTELRAENAELKRRLAQTRIRE